MPDFRRFPRALPGLCQAFLCQAFLLLAALALPLRAAELPPSDPQPTLMVLGDSLSAAYGIAVEDGWVSLLQQALASGEVLPAGTGANWRVVNASISGETTSGALTRLPKLLATFSPAVVIIELGGNDGLRGQPISQLRSNLASLVTLSQQAGARVVLVGMKIPPNYGSRYTSQFYESYALTAQHYNVPLVPFLLQGIATQPALMQEDGIHPRAEAQAAMLENVMPAIRAVLNP